MTNDVELFPRPYRKNIQKLKSLLHTDAETAFAMMLMTSVMTDLNPDDERVTEIIMADCASGTAV